MSRARLGTSPCGGSFEAPISLWWSLAAVAAAAVRGGGEAEAPRSRCVEELAAGLRLLGYRVERVSGSRLVVVEEEQGGKGGSLAARCGLLPAALLVPLAAVRLAPGRRLVLRSEAAGGEAGRALVEAAAGLGARAWRLESGRGLVVEAGGGVRRFVAGRLYSGWLPLAAGLLYAAAAGGLRLVLTVPTGRLIGQAWLEAAVELLGLEPGFVLRGTRLVYDAAEGPAPGARARPLRSPGALLAALLPLARLGGRVEATGLGPREAELAARAAAEMGLRVETACGGKDCRLMLEAARLEEARPQGRLGTAARLDPDMAFPLAASAAMQGGGEVEAAGLVYEGYVSPGQAVRLGSLEAVYERGVLRVRRLAGEVAAGTCGDPLGCALALGELAAGGLEWLEGLEALDDRLPGFLELSQMAGCLA